MATIFDSLRDNSGVFLAFLLVFNFIIGVFLVSLMLRVRKAQSRMRLLLSGVDGADLEAVLVQHGKLR